MRKSKLLVCSGQLHYALNPLIHRKVFSCTMFTVITPVALLKSSLDCHRIVMAMPVEFFPTLG